LAYPFFMELFSRTSVAVRDWLDWDEKTYRFRNELNFNEYLGWLYPEDSEDDVPEGAEPKKDWENRVITKRDDIRYIAYLINDAPDFFQQFRRDHDLDRAYAEARAKEIKEQGTSIDDVLKSVDSCTKAIGAIGYMAMRDDATKKRIEASLGSLRAVINAFLG
jgi:hypothetical protein